MQRSTPTYKSPQLGRKEVRLMKKLEIKVRKLDRLQTTATMN